MTILLVVVVAAFAGMLLWKTARQERRRAPRDAPHSLGSTLRATAHGQSGGSCALQARSASENQTTERLATIEERVERCAVCGGAFVLRYSRHPHAGEPGDTVVEVSRVRCGVPSCQQWQPLIVPVSADNICTREWLGSADAIPEGPTLLEVLTKSDSPKPRSAQS